VQPHEPRLRAWLQSRFPHISDLRDILQDTYARLFRARNQGGVRSVRAFLFIAAHNSACDVFRRQRPDLIASVEDISSLPVLEDRPNAAELTSRNEEIQILAEAMRTLPPRCRQVFTLRKLFGLSQKEIAERMGISEHTVEVQICKGSKLCAAYLRARGMMR
jgi:RNA polymerase sigma-70 factor (ECF subfamily)